MKTIEYTPPPNHVKFIAWGEFLLWAQHLGFPFKTVRGLRMAFRRKGGKYGKEAKSPHSRIPVPVEQAVLFLGGYKIRARAEK